MLLNFNSFLPGECNPSSSKEIGLDQCRCELLIQIKYATSTENFRSAADVGKFLQKCMPRERFFFLFFLNGRNLLAIPALSATAEQSFSATRRRKTWLRYSVDKLALITLLFYMCTRTSTLTVQSKAAIC